MSILNIKNVLSCFDCDLPATLQLSVDGLRVSLECVDPSLLHWVSAYLDPWPTWQDEHCRKEIRISCIYSDERVAEITQQMIKNSDTTRTRGYEFRRFYTLQIAPHIQLFLDKSEGLVWVVDQSAQRAAIIFSSKTRWPASEFARFTREVLSRHLEDNGWAKYHAGAVSTSMGNLMILGDAAAGKTSLILALLDCGAQFVSNERLYIKIDGSGIRSTGYPMSVAIGLGTALQYPTISRFITAPHELACRQRRLSQRNLKNTPREEWPKLSDKIQLLPTELTSTMNAVPPQCSVAIDAIVVPRINKHASKAVAKQFAKNKLINLLEKNELTLDRSYPDWANLRHSDSLSYNNELSTIPAIEVDFFVERKTARSSADCESAIANALAK